MIDALSAVDLPGLRLQVLFAEMSAPLGELPASAASNTSPQPAPPSTPPAIPADLRTRVRDVLRQRGYRPTGRGKPSSEYLANAAAEGRMPVVNPLVDAGNAVSLASGLPISVVDAGLLRSPLEVRLGRPGERYVFNASGQEIDVAGLPCLADADGPCGNAVKDAQRTKTSPQTRAVLAIVWGVEFGGDDLSVSTGQRLAAAFAACGAVVRSVAASRVAEDAHG